MDGKRLAAEGFVGAVKLRLDLPSLGQESGDPSGKLVGVTLDADER